MSASYFISDLHLDPARPEISRAFYHFLSNLHNRDTLYILGDLFESWVGDDDDSELAGACGAALSRFTGTGAACYLMHGNRDFLVGQAFCARAGVQLLPDPSVIDLNGTRTLLLHGDSLCTADTAYQTFRQKVRSPAWRAEISAKSLAERRELALQLRELSHEAKSNKAQDIVDVSPGAVAQAMREHAVRHLIHGHTHRPGTHTLAEGQRWVLGDWESGGTGLKVTSEEWTLFNIL